MNVAAMIVKKIHLEKNEVQKPSKEDYYRDPLLSATLNTGSNQKDLK